MGLKQVKDEAATGRARVRRARRARSPGRPAATDRSVGADAIVLKACELLRDGAPRELSLVKLARHAGVDRSLIRYYFKDRHGLLLAAARHLFGVMTGRLDAVSTQLSSDPVRRIREMAVALLNFQVEHPYFHRLMIDEVVHSPRAEARGFFRTFTAQGVESFREMAAATARRGVTRPHEGVFLYLAIIGICEFFVTGGPILKVAFGENYDAADINQQFARFLREYVIDGIRRS
ncbi:MAG TPA: TetR/AcrR family transcriptional regulator [Steroidobacteraceae bacterium]